MTFYDEEELKNLFHYLTQNETVSAYTASKESILFGLQNYALGIPKEDLAYLLNKITLKKEEVITFDEFKKFWQSNINKEVDTHQFSIQILRHNTSFIKCMAYQKSRVIQITFYCCPILIKFQPDARLGGIIAAVDNPCIAQPEESLRIITHSGIILQRGQPEFLFMFL